MKEPEKVNSRCFLLISGRHIGVPYLYTNMASPYIALQKCVKCFGKKLRNCTVGHKDLDKWFIYLSFHFLGFFHWTVSSLFFVPYSLRHWQWKRSITVYLLACVAGAWKYWAKVRTGAREGDKRGVSPLSPSVSPSRAPLFSCAHYFQTPTTQAIYLQIYESLFKAFLLSQWKRYHVYYDEPFNTAKYLDARWRSQTRYNLRQQW